MIEYARLMSPEELNKFYASVIKRKTTHKSNASVILESRTEDLKIACRQYEDAEIQRYHERRKSLQQTYRLWKEKTCTCGKPLRLVHFNGGKFWGCTDYKNSAVRHKSFNEGFEGQILSNAECLKVEIDRNWATTVLRLLGLESVVAASDIITFLPSIGLEDLREKYGYKNSLDGISAYVRARKIATNEELEIKDYLVQWFQKCSYQTGVRYKKAGEKEKVCIIDLVVSNKTTVFIIEIKRHYYDANPKQLELYQQLLSHIMNDKSDTRDCIPVFVVYNKEEVYLPPKYNFLFFYDITSKKDEASVISILTAHSLVSSHES